MALMMWFVRARCARSDGCTPSRETQEQVGEVHAGAAVRANVAVADARFGNVGMSPAALRLSSSTFGSMYANPSAFASAEMYVLYAVTAAVSAVCSAASRMKMLPTVAG